MLFAEFCYEHNCLNSPGRFPNSFSRFEYFRKENGFVGYEAYDDTKFEVILMCALPASGKDTWVQKNYGHLPVISLDDIRETMDVLPTDDQGGVISQARSSAKEYLRAKKSFVWNATNITYSLRRQLVSLFTDYGASVKIVYLEAPYKEILKRNRERSRNVPENVIDKMIKKLEVPSVIEAHEVIWIVEN
jgi:predicted kinase